jgi:ABC-type antimicrobial peptide transport system permease subunit
MFRNNFKLAWRNLVKSKGFSFINITGLAIGMAVALLIGLWVWDELSYNRSFDNYNRLGQLYQNRTFNGKPATYKIQPQPMAKELRDHYPDFKEVALASFIEDHVLAWNEKKISTQGIFAEPQFSKMFSLKMVEGIQNGLEDPRSILLSESMAETLFGKEQAIGKIVKADNLGSLTVKGIYKDFPKNTDFARVQLIMPWEYLHSFNPFANKTKDTWGSNNHQCFVQLNDNANLAAVQKKIFGIINSKVSEGDKASKPEVLLLPMNRWRLYGDFTNGKNTGGFITIVRLFALVGIFVLLLACINYMNLSTARSEKRAREVGVRKTIGSAKSQLIYQFLSESFLITLFSFILSLALVSLALPWFNSILAKDLGIAWSSPLFWTISLGFIVLTSLLAGSYPAFYLSSFRPIKVLKGHFRSGKLASIPRKALVVIQFTVSVTLIIGTIIVYRQIQFAKDRPLGYDTNGLVYVYVNTPELVNLDYTVLRNELLNTNVVENISKSTSTLTGEGNLTSGFSWDGLPANSDVLFTVMSATQDYSKTVGLEFVRGRDFLPDFKSDSASVLVNETAARAIGEKDIIGKVLTLNNIHLTVIGEVKDMVRSSPYSRPLPAIFTRERNFLGVINIKIKPTVGVAAALKQIGTVFAKVNPAVPFEYKFGDELVAQAFESEVLIGKLSTFFAFLAIFISCLGIFGLASFVAEQRTKEIGVRKVLGASVFNVWRLLSKDFIILVVISFIIAAPIAWYFMHDWLENYEYHTPISWWIYVATCGGTVLITLSTVSYQAIRSALANPVKSLRTE